MNHREALRDASEDRGRRRGEEERGEEKRGEKERGEKERGEKERRGEKCVLCIQSVHTQHSIVYSTQSVLTNWMQREVV